MQTNHPNQKIPLNDMGKFIYNIVMTVIDQSDFSIDGGSTFPDGQYSDIQQYAVSIGEDGSGLFPQIPAFRFGNHLKQLLIDWGKNREHKLICNLGIEGPFQTTSEQIIPGGGSQPTHAVWIVKIQYLLDPEAKAEK